MSIKSQIEELEKYKNTEKVVYIPMVRLISVDFNVNNKKYNLSMNLPNLYPCSPPQNIYLNHCFRVDYQLQFYRFLKGNQTIIKKYFETENLSEASILHPRNWKTKFKILDIVHEFELFQNMVSCSILFRYFDNKGLLNDDVLRNVASYIK